MTPAPGAGQGAGGGTDGESGTSGAGASGRAGTSGTSGTGEPVGGDATLADPTSASGGAFAEGGRGGGVATGEPEQPVGIECMGGRADVQRHSAHCGECGHACEPIEIASELDWPVGVALNATTVFWITRGDNAQVLSAPLLGGEVTVLAQTEPFPNDIKVDATHVYYAGQGTIYRLPLQGGTPEPLTMTQVTPINIAVDSTHVYWVNRGDGDLGSVMKVPLSGGEPITLVSVMGTDPTSIAIDGAYAYWVNGYNDVDRMVLKVPLEGGEAITLATGRSNAFSIAVDAANVYWVAHDTVAAGLGAAIASTVGKVSIDGGTPVTLATGTHMPMAIAIDSVSAYWTNASTSQVQSAVPGTDGTVDSVPLAGGSPRMVGPEQGEPTAIASNGTTLCWGITGYGAGSGSVKCLGVCESGACK